ncbi:MAG: L-lactate dehydrogenase (quinone) large subunit LdhH [Armatimonadota bacterium]
MSSKQQKQKINKALHDEYLQTALKRAVSAYRKARETALDGFDFEGARKEVRAIKEKSINQIPELFKKFKEEAEKVGAVVHEAKDGVETAEIIRKLAEERSVKLIVKSKSMLTEELELNHKLQKFGLEVVETDLGEWIIQLAGEKPSHFTAPAMHKTREQVAELFSKATGENLDSDVALLVEVARKQLRRYFIDADMGISGANILVAETGSLVIVANEGNDRLVTTLPDIHVAVVGYEKLVPTMDDALSILKILSKSGTGQKQTAYISFITGPSRTTDIEKTLALGVHGPKEVHIIFVDNGRKAMLEDDILKEALYCIKCGACLNMCPVYKSVGGHAFGNSYMGGIGAVLTTYHQNLQASEDTVNMCAGCSYCTSICPSKIDVPKMVREIRERLVDKNGMPLTGKLPLGTLKNPKLFQKAIKFARAFQKPFQNEQGKIKHFPFLPDDKDFPAIASEFLREKLPERSGESKEIKVGLFAGCVIDFVYPEIGESIWKVLTKSDVEVIFPHNQGCCGAPAMYVGDDESALKMAMDTVIAMHKDNPDYIVTGCPTCAMMFKEHFPEILADTPWKDKAIELSKKVMDFAQFASEKLNLDIKKDISESVTYHDPCHQVRGVCSSECSRKLITESGFDLVEMVDSNECCGFAGSYSLKQSGISGSILNRKLENVENTSAKIVATDCPGCIMQIGGGLSKKGSDIRVCHTAQLLAELFK